MEKEQLADKWVGKIIGEPFRNYNPKDEFLSDLNKVLRRELIEYVSSELTDRELSKSWAEMIVDEYLKNREK